MAIVLAGFVAGAVNTIVGSGSLISYPVMVALGVPPVTANIANSVGLTPGSLAGAWSYRSKLAGVPRRPLAGLCTASVVGAVIGASLLTVLSAQTFQILVPILILLATVLMAFQPRIARTTNVSAGTLWIPLGVLVFLAGVYGGYFSAAQGVILLGILGLFMSGDIQRHNAVKNVLQAIVNLVASVFFMVTGAVDWNVAGAIAVGAVLGAFMGGTLGKRIPQRALRLGVIVFGAALTVILTFQTFANMA